MSDESIFSPASKLIYDTRRQEKHKVPEGHLDPKTRVACPCGFQSVGDVKDWIDRNQGRNVVCDDCQEHNRCLLEIDAYVALASKEAQTR